MPGRSPANFARHRGASRQRLPRLRPGTAYILVMGACMLVSILGITGVIAARLQARAGTLRTDQREASTYARSAITMARYWMDQDTNWRTARAPGTWASRQPLGQGSFS